MWVMQQCLALRRTCMSYEEEDTCMSYEEEDTWVIPSSKSLPVSR